MITVHNSLTGQKEELESRFEGYYADKLEQTGLEATEDRDKAQLQDALVEFLAETAKQPGLRQELTTMATAYTGFGTDSELHPQAVNPIIIGTALKVAVDELGGEFVDHLRDLALGSTDAVVRRRMLAAIGSTKDPVKAAEVLELVFSDELRDNEIYSILFPQVFMAETRDATWDWFQQNIDRILERIPETSWGNVAFVGSAFCDPEKQAEVESFFEERIKTLTGGPRTLAKALEGINLCVAKVEHHKADLNEWIGQ